MTNRAFDTSHPYNIGNNQFSLTVRILPQFVTHYNAMEISGKAVKILIDMGNGVVKLLPEKHKQIAIWQKGEPANIIYESFPNDLKLLNLDHIQWIKIDVSNI